jgi:hypothetical protein
MRIHPTNPGLFLVELADLKADPLDARVSRALEPLSQTARWAKDYLCSPHPELGRTGAVCPFTSPSMRRNLFYLTVVHGEDVTVPQVEALVREYRDWFLEMDPRDPKVAQYKSINILFPDIPQTAWSTVIEAAQDRLKPEFVPHGIMVGEFHPGPPDKEALRNPSFRPLRSPCPLLSIRHMVPTDFAFLKHRPDFMTAFLQVHGGSIDRLPGDQPAEVRRVAAAFGLALPGEARDSADPHPPPAADDAKHPLPSAGGRDAIAPNGSAERSDSRHPPVSIAPNHPLDSVDAHRPNHALSSVDAHDSNDALISADSHCPNDALASVDAKSTNRARSSVDSHESKQALASMCARDAKHAAGSRHPQEQSDRRDQHPQDPHDPQAAMEESVLTPTGA